MTRCLVALGAIAAGALPLPAQVPDAGAQAALAPAAATITAAALTPHIRALTADSMRGRATPSRELDQTARYLAQQFRQLGLHPVRAGDSTLIWRYPVPGQLALDYSGTHLRVTYELTRAAGSIFTETGSSARRSFLLDFDTAASFVPEAGPPVVALPTLKSFFEALRMGGTAAVVVAGPHTVASLSAARLADKVVLYVPSPIVDSATRRQVLRHLYEASAGVLVVADLDLARFAAARQRARQQHVTIVDRYLREAQGARRWPWAAGVRSAALTALFDIAGLDLAALRASPTPLLRELSHLQVWLEPAVDTTAAPSTAPVVAAVLDGADTTRPPQSEYLVLMAHMDASVASAGGAPAGGAAAHGQGADDNAPGVAGLVALAAAMSQPGVRPRHSVLFLATSGGARGHDAWGVNAYIDPIDGGAPFHRQIMAVINLDQIGRLQGDSVTVDGLRDVDLAVRADWLAMMHPDLRLVIADGGSAVTRSAEHFPFVYLGIPTLAVHGGDSETMAAAGAPSGGRVAPTDAAPTGDANQTARIVRYVFYLSESLANADRRPRLTAEGRRHLAESAGP